MELDITAWVSFFPSINSIPIGSQTVPLLATATAAETNSLVLAGVLLSLVVIYLASKVGGELCTRINLPPVLGELLGGVIVGVSALHLLVFAESGDASSSFIITVLKATAGLSPETTEAVFHTQSEVISLLSELGVIILLFEIGLESNLRELLAVGAQALIVAVVGVVVPFAAGTVGLMYLFGVAAVIDDVLGIIVLAVVASLAKTGEVDVANVLYLIISATVFLIGAILLGS